MIDSVEIDIPPTAKRELLKEWREKHWKQLDKTIKVLIDIRDANGEGDGPKISPKDRIEAGKAISRMLGVLAAEKADSAGAGTVMAKPTLKSKHMDELEELLGTL